MRTGINEPPASERLARGIFLCAAAALIGVAAPVIWRGAPLADDFNNCVGPRELGLGAFMSASWHQLGFLRPARFLEILLTSSVCNALPFGVAIAVPLALTVVVAVLASGLLRDVGVPREWAAVSAAMWLMQPLGTESALWPAALHVPLGLALGLGALRCYRRGRHGWAVLLNVCAALSVEQLIFALPVAAWLVTPAERRRRAAAVSALVGVAALAGFTLWPGHNPRLRVTALQRLSASISNPVFYAGYVAVGLGLHSIPLAVHWALPWSAAILAAGAGVGARLGPGVTAANRPVSSSQLRRALLGTIVLIALANLVVVFAVPQQGSPRVFTPTWLILAMALPAAAATVRWPRARLVGASGGLLAAGALLSIAFSVSLRLKSADFAEHASRFVAARVPEDGAVAICGVRRTVAEPAPRGAFAVHDFVYEWSAERAITYYTGRHTAIQLAGDLWARPCPSSTVGRVILFDELRNEAGQ